MIHEPFACISNHSQANLFSGTVNTAHYWQDLYSSSLPHSQTLQVRERRENGSHGKSKLPCDGLGRMYAVKVRAVPVPSLSYSSQICTQKLLLATTRVDESFWFRRVFYLP